MARKGAWVLVTCLVLPTFVTAAETCATLEACLAKYPAAASSDPGVGTNEQELAEAVQEYGAQAVPGLIQLLESSSRNARELAGYTLRDIDGLKPEHLPALIKARRGGDGWIPPAIARVGTPEAIAFLIDDLRRDPEMHTQVTGALEMLGEKAAIPLAELFACTMSCKEDVFRVAGFVLGSMEERALVAVPRLLEIARDHQYEGLARRYAISALGSVGESAANFAPQLNTLKKEEPLLANVVDAALAGLKSADAVPALVQALPQDPEDALSQLSRLGKNGFSAGPAVLRYLDARDWDVRVAAARTLGKIEYGQAEPALAKALTDQDDWKLVYAAVLSLADLDARGSLDALKRVRDSHWYPPVRKLAADAIGNIESGSEVIEPDWWRDATVDGAPKSCVSVREKAIKEPKSRKLYESRHSSEIQRLAFPSAIHSYGPAEGTEPNKDGVIVVNESNMVEYVKEIRQVPNVALKVPDGWIVGADRGEWGGALVHIPARGNNNVLSGENITDIFFLGDHIVATSGIAHLVMNRGYLLRIDMNDTGRYMATPWKRLPAEPGMSRLLEGNRLLINTFDGGSVIVDANGTFRMAECLKTQPED